MNTPFKPLPVKPDHWSTQALCALPENKPTRDRDLWFSEDPAEITEAHAICRRCPVLDDCAIVSKKELYGIWAADNKFANIHERNKHLPQCNECSRTIRPRNAFAEDWPGTIATGREGYCQLCSRSGNEGKTLRTKIMPGQPCKNCEQPMRPSRAKKTDYPDTVLHHSNGNCATCYTAARRAAA